MNQIRITEITELHFNDFLEYLKKHLSENGDNNVFYLPLSKEQSAFNKDWETKFKMGTNTKMFESGWRKLWIAINHDNQIVGHADIRSRKELNTEHRVLLGMGTDINFRNLKIGQHLLKFVINYCKNNPQISWIDLEVLANNTPAIRIYEKMEFKLLSHVMDMFRINYQSFDYKFMSLNVDS